MGLFSFYGALIFIVLALLARFQQGDWFAPGAFISGFWAVLVVLPLIFAPDYFYSLEALLLLWSAVASVYLGSLVGDTCWVRLFRGPERTSFVNRPFPFIKSLIFLGAISGFVAVFYLLMSADKGFSVFASLGNLASTGREFSIARYHEGYIPPFASRLLLAVTYFSILLGGGFFASVLTRRAFVFSMLPFLPMLAYSAVLTMRANLLFSMIFWLSGYVSMRLFMSGRAMQLFNWRWGVYSSALGSFVLAVFVVLQMSRYGWDSAEQMWDVLSRLRVWFFGYLSGFSVWVSGGMSSEGLSLGAFTFAGLFDLLGISERLQGVYQNFVMISDIRSTNIFTALRGLIHDFGVFGSLGVLFFVGIFASLAYFKVKSGELFMLPYLSLYYIVILWSHVVSPLTYNSLLLAWLLMLVYFTFFSISNRGFMSPRNSGCCDV